MPYNLLLFPLIAGYLFLSIFYYTRYRAYGLEGHRILLESVWWGLLLAVPAALLVEWLGALIPGLRPAWKDLAPFDHSGKAAAVVFLGFVIPSGLNVFIWFFELRERVARSVLRRYGDPLARLFLEAQTRSQPVQISMANGKVYVGLVVMGLSLNPPTRTVRLLPYLSGYRSDETQRVVFTTSYAEVLEKMSKGEDEILKKFSASDLQVVVPMDEIESARLFDFGVYKVYFHRQTLVAEAGGGVGV